MNLNEVAGALQALAQRVESSTMQINEPSPEHMSFIPAVQRSNVLLMKSKALEVENMTTLFIGSIRQNYTRPMWDADVQKWMSKLGTQRYYYIILQPWGERDAMDSTDAIPKMEQALLDINTLPAGEKIRVIVLGTGHAGFLFDALSYLLREWKNSTGTARTGKYLQFITAGDTEKRSWCHFCQWLCISEVCETVEFYNTMSYHPFGFCSAEYKNKHK